MPTSAQFAVASLTGKHLLLTVSQQNFLHRLGSGSQKACRQTHAPTALQASSVAFAWHCTQGLAPTPESAQRLLRGLAGSQHCDSATSAGGLQAAAHCASVA